MTKPTCSVDGCERTAERRGWCNPHYRRWRKYGDPLYERPERRCSVEGCDNPHLATDLCRMHYQRKRTHGDPAYKRPARSCSVEGCERQHKGHGYCERHMKRWRKYGDPLAEVAWTKGGASGACTIDGCDEAAWARGLCPSHLARLHNGGDPTRPLKRPRSTRGDSHNRDGLRLCTACDAWKPIADYHSCASRPHESRCKTCRVVAVIDWYAVWKAANPEEAAGRVRRYSWTRRSRESANWVEDVDRDVVFARDEGRCGVCGLPVDPAEWEADHIHPVSKGGEHSYANVQVSHPSCNSVKSDRVLPLPEATIRRLREKHRHLADAA